MSDCADYELRDDVAELERQFTALKKKLVRVFYGLEEEAQRLHAVTLALEEALERHGLLERLEILNRTVAIAEQLVPVEEYEL